MALRGGAQIQFGPSFTPDVIKWLIGGCIGLHLVVMYLAPALLGWLLLSPALVFRGALWQLATAPLIAESGLGVLFGALMLWMFGSELAVRWGRKRFLTYLAWTGAGSAAALTAVAGALHALGVELGWSATLPLLSVVVLAVILAYSLMFAERETRLNFVLPIQTIYLVPAVLFIQLVLGESLLIWLADLAALAIGLAFCWREGDTRMTLQLQLHKFRRWRMRSRLRAIDNDERRRQQRRRNLH